MTPYCSNAERLSDRLRENLAEAQRKHVANPSGKTLDEYMRALRQLADLVLRGKTPDDFED
jgi:hypothetical protein